MKFLRFNYDVAVFPREGKNQTSVEKQFKIGLKWIYKNIRWNLRRNSTREMIGWSFK